MSSTRETEKPPESRKCYDTSLTPEALHPETNSPQARIPNDPHMVLEPQRITALLHAEAQTPRHRRPPPRKHVDKRNTTGRGTRDSNRASYPLVLAVTLLNWAWVEPTLQSCVLETPEHKLEGKSSGNNRSVSGVVGP